MTTRNEATEADALRVVCPRCGSGVREVCTIPGTSFESWAHLERIELATQTKGAGDGEGLAGSSSHVAFLRVQLEDEALHELMRVISLHLPLPLGDEDACMGCDWRGTFHGRHLAVEVAEWFRTNPQLAGVLTQPEEVA